MDQLDALDSKFEYIAPQGMQSLTRAFKAGMNAAKQVGLLKEDGE